VAGSILLVHSLSSELLGNHVAHDAHHSSTAVVDLNIELAGLLLGVEDVATEVANAVITVVLGGGEPCELNEANEGDDLGKAGGGNGEDAVNTSGDVGELKVVGGGDVSIEDNVVVVDNGTDDGSHSNAAVLALDSTTALKSLRLRVEPSEGIEDAKGFSDTELSTVVQATAQKRSRDGEAVPEAGKRKQESRVTERSL